MTFQPNLTHQFSVMIFAALSGDIRDCSGLNWHYDIAGVYHTIEGRIVGKILKQVWKGLYGKECVDAKQLRVSGQVRC